MNRSILFSLVAISLLPLATTCAADAPLVFNDAKPQRYELSARASRIDPRTRPHPEIGFVFEKNGKPADVEKASVDTRVKPQGKLVIWLMGYNAPLFERLNSYGLHAIQVHYANGWFDKLSKLAPPNDDQFLGNTRLEAATGKDFSKAVDIPQPDGMMERAVQFVKWLAKENPPGRWEHFLTDDRHGLRWERVIMAGASHGSTTAARFAKYQRVDRIVMFCGPRDQYETWQGSTSATPANRFFAFSHVLDGGWTGHHYDRSWELLGLNQFGPIVNVDHAAPPFGNTRRLITAADVKNDAGRAHSSVVPGGAAVKDASGRFIHEDVWRYLFTHPVEQVGAPVPHDPACPLDLRAAAEKPAAADLPFPRLMGMNIGRKHYDDADYQRQLARLDFVVLGFYKGWKPNYGMAQVVQNLKRLSHNHLLVGQYTCLSEAQDNPKDAASSEVQKKLHEMNWWARKADGTRVQWTDQYRAWDINFTSGSKADSSGRRYPQWLAEWDDRVLFKPAAFDIWYCDNVFSKPRVTADWDGDGKDDNRDNPAVAAAYRAGHRAEWEHIRKIHPGITLMGNVDGGISEPEYAGQLEGAFLEALMGKKWSIETWAGWPAVMKRYHAATANTRAPHLVGFNVAGEKSDYRFFRYAFVSCLLDDGYFCFTDSAQGYSSVPWFDEYDFKLGAAISPPPAAAWKGGVWRRDFARGIVLVNPTTQPVTVSVEPGFSRLRGDQAPSVNNGSPATTVVLAAKDGIVLKRL